MKNILIIGLKLTIICAAAALCLGMVNAMTAPKIAELKKNCSGRSTSGYQ